MDVAGPRTRPSRSWSSTAGGWRGASDGCAWRSSAPAPPRGRRERAIGARRRARSRDAAHEHPAGPPRGRRARAGLRARGGAAPHGLARCPARGARRAGARRSAPTRSRPAGGAGGEGDVGALFARFDAGGPRSTSRGIELVRHARPPQRRLRAGDDRHLPQAAGAHPGPPERSLARRVSLPPPRRRWSRRAGSSAGALERPARARRGGRPGGHHGRAGLRRRGRRRDARGGTAEARRGRLLVRARGAVARQRPARLPALLHRLPRSCWRAWRASRASRIQERLEIPILRPGQRADVSCAAEPPGPPLHLAGALARHRYLRPAQRLGRGARGLRPGAACDPARAARRPRDLRLLARRPRPGARGARRPVGPDRAARRSTSAPPRPRSSWPRSSSRPAC